ncbi:MAG: hypothetical protein ACYTA3_06710 [Planctomycetota bacterium]
MARRVGNAAGLRVLAHREVFLPPPRVCISSFGEDTAGKLYVCAFDRLDGRRGGIHRLVED